MRLTFLGGAQEIGASCAVLDLDDVRLMVDCGQRMNAPAGQQLPDFSHLEFGPPISAVILTHAHADHIGALPALESHLPRDCPIYCTEPTLAIAKVMLEDSLRIMAQHRSGSGDVPMFPAPAVAQCLSRLKPVRWGKPFRVADPNVSATWFPAGHILGAAMVEIHSGGDSILFSGDVSVADQLSVPGVFAPAIRPRVLVLESTYGSRLHAHRPAQEERLLQRVAECLEQGGHVLFPTFALGRAQEVLLLLGRGMRAGQLPRVPIWADGLVRAISKVYARFPEELAPKARKLWEQGLHPLFPDDLPIRAVRNNQQRETIALGPSCVVVASSGMLQGGASHFYARHWLKEPDNLILVTGYQDEESPGQALLQLVEIPADQPRLFNLGGVQTEVRCQAESCLLSAHADGAELTALAAKFQPQVIFPVHGDEAARAALARSLMAGVHAKVVLASNGDSFHLGDDLTSVAGRPASFRISPLSLWPPWDPTVPRDLDLARFHSWLASMELPVPWVTIDELLELWKSPATPTDEDVAELRAAVYEHAQPYFAPDAKRPYLLKVTPIENLAPKRGVVRRVSVELATKMLRELFPLESGLTRFGFYPEEGKAELVFLFPKSAHRHFHRRFGEWTEKTGWDVVVDDRTRDADLLDVLSTQLGIDPTRAKISHHPPEVTPAGLPEDLVDLDDAVELFERKTGYQLILRDIDFTLPASDTVD